MPSFFFVEPPQIPATTEAVLQEFAEHAILFEPLWSRPGRRELFRMFRDRALDAGLSAAVAEAHANDMLERIGRHIERLRSAGAVRVGTA
jgi:prephenate dehydratase